MVDNVETDAGSGGAVFATDDIASVHYPYFKVTFGADGVATLVTSSVGLPVSPLNAHSADFDTGAGTDTTLAYGIAVPASGGAAVVPGSASAGLKVDLGADNDVTLATLPDTSGGDLAAMVASLAALETSLDSIDNAVGGNELQVDVVGSLPAGTNNIGDVDVATIAAGSNLIGDVGVGVRASGGTSIFRSLDIDETEEEIKSSAGQVYWIHAVNLTAATLFLKFYNAAAASVTVGTTTPVLTFPIPTLGDTNGAGFVFCVPNGIAFDTGISVACLTGVADNDTTGPAANGCVINVGFA